MVTDCDAQAYCSNKRAADGDGDQFSKLCKVMSDGFSGMQKSIVNMGKSISDNLLEPFDCYEGYGTKGEDGDMDVLNEITKDFSEDVEFGPKLNEDIANIVNNMMKSKASETSSKARKEIHKRPENCEYLQVPKDNPEIWNAVPMNTRAHDSALQTIQGLLLTGVTPIARTMEKLYDALNSGVLEDLDLKSSIKELSDAIAFSGEANATLNKLRKTEFKKTMPAKFHKLCTYRVL